MPREMICLVRQGGEILMRKWDHIDWNEGEIRLDPGETKSGRGRNVPMMPELRDVLNRWRQIFFGQCA